MTVIFDRQGVFRNGVDYVLLRKGTWFPDDVLAVCQVDARLGECMTRG